ncbi:MAG: hypothetical protein DYG94_02775 [Leptolyngbya sp. PLA3]|nr:MAG: hypothetical protein EDM82_11520 [Cyanobacteria bacterium CYA]MCE7967652.1 hypothetical protein [Leptolyngbya sp. PL-A3]
MTPWFDEQTAGMVGGLLGAGVGTVFGALGGGVGGPLAAMGKAKAVVLGLFYFGVAVGVGLTITGLATLAMGQPWWVWVSFVGPGVLTAGLMGGLLPVVRMRYRQAEQRKLDAQSFRG